MRYPKLFLVFFVLLMGGSAAYACQADMPCNGGDTPPADPPVPPPDLAEKLDDIWSTSLNGGKDELELNEEIMEEIDGEVHYIFVQYDTAVVDMSSDDDTVKYDYPIWVVENVYDKAVGTMELGKFTYSGQSATRTGMRMHVTWDSVSPGKFVATMYEDKNGDKTMNKDTDEEKNSTAVAFNYDDPKTKETQDVDAGFDKMDSDDDADGIKDPESGRKKLTSYMNDSWESDKNSTTEADAEKKEEKGLKRLSSGDRDKFDNGDKNTKEMMGSLDGNGSLEDNASAAASGVHSGLAGDRGPDQEDNLSDSATTFSEANDAAKDNGGDAVSASAEAGGKLTKGNSLAAKQVDIAKTSSTGVVAASKTGDRDAAEASYKSSYSAEDSDATAAHSVDKYSKSAATDAVDTAAGQSDGGMGFSNATGSTSTTLNCNLTQKSGNTTSTACSN